MASFTDSPQTFFSQPSQPVNLELYDQALQTKQNQYNSGVQRIQGSIDQVAGLDVMHPLAKEYLDQKLGELGTKVNSLASGDFSNTSLVNQAMALAPEVAKDEKIQTALIATQQIRALSASQKRLYEKDPNQYPSSMRYMDNKPVSDYLNGTDLNEGYHGVTEASRYTDYHKNIEDLVKQIVPDVKFWINHDGKYQWKTEKYTTVTNDRIQAAINGYLASNPEATKSLNADALYTYKDATPDFLARHLDETYSSNIQSLKDINHHYLLDMLSNPTSRDFIDDRTAAMAANEKTIQEMESKRKLYPQYLNNPSMVDEVKKTIFADNLKGMFSTVFQKDDIDRKIEENYNAKDTEDFSLRNQQLGINKAQLALDQIKTKDQMIASGHEPYLDKNGNPIDLTPNSKNWASYQASLKGSKGKKDGSSGDSENSFDGNPQVGGKIPEEKYSNTALLENQKKVLMDAIQNDQGTGLKDTFFNNWANKYAKDIPDKSKAKAAFDNMLNTQMNAWINGEPTTPEFREYWQRASIYNLKLDALEQLKDKALEYGKDMNPIPTQDKDYIDAVSTISSNLYKRGINLQAGNELFGNSTFQKRPFGSIISDTTDKYDPRTLPISPDEASYRMRRGALTSEVMKYKGTPIYDKLKALSDAGETNFRKASTDVNYLINNITDKRSQSTEDYLKQNEKDYAPQEYLYAGKDSDPDYKQTQKRILSLLGEQQGVGRTGQYDMKKFDLDDVQVLSAYTDATNKVTYKFKLKGQKEDYITSTQPGTDGILPVDPDLEMKQIVHMTGMTPTKGNAVLATRDGKIRYAIGESTYDPNQYDAYVIIKGQPVPIKTTLPNGDIFHHASPSQIQKSLEELAMQPSRINPKVPMSREEALDKLTMDQHEYEAKYPKPTK